MKDSTLKITTIAMMCAIALVVVAVFRIPIMADAPYLKYDPKDTIILIGGFIYGPLAALAMAFIVTALEALTVGTSGVIGFIMNFFAALLFAGTASLIYKKKKNINGAVLGLVGGSIVFTIGMLAWNYVFTPMYQSIPRAAMAKMLVPVILPFNLIKAGLNSTIVMIIYKPITNVLRKLGFIKGEAKDSKLNIRYMVISGIILAMFIAAVVFLTAKVVK